MAGEAEVVSGEAPLVIEQKEKDSDNELLNLCEHYHVPPSPSGIDTITTHYANGTLGDIMAAEFRDLSMKNTPSVDLDLHSDSDAKSDPESSDQEEADRTLLQSTMDIPPSIDVYEIESQSLGPSILGADELYNAVAFGDGETHSRQRILSFAAKRCAKAVQRNSQDYDALYNWALVLQESADILDGDTGGAAKDQLLEEACAKYKAATDLCPTLHEAFYNWAIAISDRAKARGRTKEAEELWKEACKRYERAVQLNHNSPQAFNNWGLALQELSGIVPIKDKKATVKSAVKKFRAAISLQFDFHRAIYNLGTVMYGLAEDTTRSGDQQPSNRELTATELYSQSAVYVAAAHALKPEYPVYKSALRLVRSKLPLAYLKTGYLSVPPQNDSLATHNDWRRLWFVLDHEALYQVDKDLSGSSQADSTKGSNVAVVGYSLKSEIPYAFHIEIADICGVIPCADLSLPHGAGFCIDTVHGLKYLIAETWEEVDCWVDALRCVYAIYSRGQSDVLGGIIAG